MSTSPIVTIVTTLPPNARFPVLRKQPSLGR
jgi:hypothetical protein